MTPNALLRRYLDECPLVGIIRGVTPDEAEAIGEAIFDSGIRIIEVPLNSPDDHRAKQVHDFRFPQPGLQSGFVGHSMLCELARELEVLLASRENTLRSPGHAHRGISR